MGEFELIARLAPLLGGIGDGVVVGHGDDAAVLTMGDLAGVCLTVDALVADVHFRRDLSSLGDVGWKAIAVNASDLAAMGAQPRAAVVTLCRPASLAVDDVEAIYEGMQAACARWGMSLVGGDTVASPTLVLSVTALGGVDPASAVRRGGARPGDRVVVVGPLGAAAAALAQLAAGMEPDPSLLAAHRRPVALVRAGQVLAAHGATAMIDVSDGLGADLGQVCAASGVRARIDWSCLPVAAGAQEAARAAGRDPVEVVAGGGEDFALLAAVPAGAAEAAAVAAGNAEGVAAAVVGEFAPAGGPAVLLARDGYDDRDLSTLGYDHFPKGRS